MSIEGILLKPGEARMVGARGMHVAFLVTGAHAHGAAVFEFTAAPGFEVGAHIHHSLEEVFYVLEGELDLRVGDRIMRGGPGTFMFVPKEAPHAFSNPGSTPAKMLLIVSPPGQEHYFEELAEILAREGPPDTAAIAALRKKYDTEQLADLKAGS